MSVALRRVSHFSPLEGSDASLLLVCLLFLVPFPLALLDPFSAPSSSPYVPPARSLPMLDREAQRSPAAAAAFDVGFTYVAGVVSRAQRPVLERQSFLASRGNVFSIFSDADFEGMQPFVMFFMGATLRKKVTRVCESLGVRLYLFPETDQAREGAGRSFRPKHLRLCESSCSLHCSRSSIMR